MIYTSSSIFCLRNNILIFRLQKSVFQANLFQISLPNFTIIHAKMPQNVDFLKFAEVLLHFLTKMGHIRVIRRVSFGVSFLNTSLNTPHHTNVTTQSFALCGRLASRSPPSLGSYASSTGASLRMAKGQARRSLAEVLLFQSGLRPVAPSERCWAFGREPTSLSTGFACGEGSFVAFLGCVVRWGETTFPSAHPSFVSRDLHTSFTPNRHRFALPLRSSLRVPVTRAYGRKGSGKRSFPHASEAGRSASRSSRLRLMFGR